MTPLATESVSLFGWPLFLIFGSVFVVNFLFARHMTVLLVRKKFIKRKSEEFQKALILWFFPIVGGLGLFMLLITHQLISIGKGMKKWFLLQHT